MVMPLRSPPKDDAGYVIGIRIDQQSADAHGDGDQEQEMWAAYADFLEPIDALDPDIRQAQAP